MSIQHQTSSDTIDSIRAALQLPQERLAHALGVSTRTIVRWETEGEEPPPLERERLELIYDVVRLAQEILKPQDLTLWFKTEKESLSGKSPIDLFSSFRAIQQIQVLLERARWGLF